MKQRQRRDHMDNKQIHIRIHNHKRLQLQKKSDPETRKEEKTHNNKTIIINSRFNPCVS